MNRVFKRVMLIVAALAIAVVLALIGLLSLATIELTEHGVHNRLLLPGGIAIQMYTGTGEKAFLAGFLDGPIVRRLSKDEWIATWYCQDQVGQSRGSGDTLSIQCAGETRTFPLAPTPVPAAVAPMPDKLVVLSDLEGKAEFLDAALHELGVVDDSGRWQFGRGHLVVLGDSVDRGRDVFAVLWRLYSLAAQANAAGGAVHFVIGNHEQYMLRTNISRANREHLHALRAMGGYEQAFAANTTLGAWLRGQPVILKLGSVLFVHGGISPDVVATGLSIDQLNVAMSEYWGMPRGAIARTSTLDAVLGFSGVTQYRGYLMAIANQYPLATQGDVNGVLKHFNATQIVVGHTIVERVTSLFDGHVYAVDVDSPTALQEVLVYESGVPRSVSTGLSRNLGQQERTTQRAFRVFDSADWRLLLEMYRKFRTLASLPHPY